MIYGYALTPKERFDEVYNILHNLGIDNIYLDARAKQTFATTPKNRPKFYELLEVLNHNDTVYITTLDDLGYGFEDMLEQWIELTQKHKVDVVVANMPLVDTRWQKDLIGSYVTDVVISFFGYMAEKRKIARQHQQESFARSRAAGVRFGSPPKPLPFNFSVVCDDYLKGKITLCEDAKLCGMAKQTFKKKLLAYNSKDNTNIDKIIR